MLTINESVLRIIHWKHMLSYGVWVFCGLTIALLLSRAQTMMWMPIAAVSAALASLYWRWTFTYWRIRDARVANPILTDAVDLAWLEWVRSLEPRIDALLKSRSPKNVYTLRDFQAAYAEHAYYIHDLPKRAPYYGDVDRCIEEIALRRSRERASERPYRPK